MGKSASHVLLILYGIAVVVGADISSGYATLLPPVLSRIASKHGSGSAALPGGVVKILILSC